MREPVQSNHPLHINSQREVGCQYERDFPHNEKYGDENNRVGQIQKSTFFENYKRNMPENYGLVRVVHPRQGPLEK